MPCGYHGRSEIGRVDARRGAWLASRLVPVLVWTVAILWIATRPRAVFFSEDAKLLWSLPRSAVQYPYHVGVYTVLAILARRCGLPTQRQGAWWPGAMAVLVGLLVSGASELAQLYVPTRSATVKDLFLDLAGTIMGLVAARRIPVLRE